MEALDHITAIIDGDIGPETTRWLSDAVKASISNRVPLERSMGLFKGLRSAFFRGQRDRNIADGSQATGSARRYIEAYDLWRVGRQPSGGLGALFDELRALESEGFRPPGLRQAQRAAKARNDKKSPDNVVPLPLGPPRLSMK